MSRRPTNADDARRQRASGSDVPADACAPARRPSGLHQLASLRARRLIEASVRPMTARSDDPASRQPKTSPARFCGYLGWTVAWSSMCIDDAEDAGPTTSEEEPVGADLERELRPDARRERCARAGGRKPVHPPSTCRRRRRACGTAAERGGCGGGDRGRRSEVCVAPVADSLEKLRDFLDASGVRAMPALSPAETAVRSLRRTLVRPRRPQEPRRPIDRPPIPREPAGAARGHHASWIRGERLRLRAHAAPRLQAVPRSAGDPAAAIAADRSAGASNPALDPPPATSSPVPSDPPIGRDDEDAPPLASDGEESAEELT